MKDKMTFLTFGPKPSLFSIGDATTAALSSDLSLFETISGIRSAGDGAMTIVTYEGTCIIFSGAGADTITISDGSDFIFAGEGANTISGLGGDKIIIVGAGADTITVTSGNNTIHAGDGANTITTGSGENVIFGGAGVDTIKTNGGNSYIDSGNGANTITTGNGNDTIISGIDADTIATLGGNDTIIVRGGTDTIDAGAGTDTLVVDYSAATTNVANSVSEGTLAAGYAGNFSISGTTAATYASVENFSVTTGSGNDSIKTGDGNDMLMGGVGADTLDGWLGDDTVGYSSSSTGVVVNLATGINTGGDATGDTLIGIENLTGSSHDDSLSGDAGDNTISGEAGSDTLNGGAGADILNGGLGDDSYVTDGSDIIAESFGAGTDLVLSSATATLGSNLENLTLTGSSAINGTGNALNNTVTGNSAANRLTGGAGADTLIGGAGKDLLSGQAGHDTFIFNNVVESAITATTTDVITDFVRGQDKINLTAIDAFSFSLTNDAFIWKGTAAFSSKAQGEVRYQKFDNKGTTNDYTMVWIDNDADTGVEMAIRLTGLHNLTSADFIL